jgi:alkaline phosphatase
MEMRHPLLWGLRVLLSAAAVLAASHPVRSETLDTPKAIIFMVPDGLGLSAVTAARIFARGPDGAPLAFETLEHIGYQRTHAANALITDSAAAASAWSMGEKFDRGAIACRDSDGDRRCDERSATILEIAGRKGMATGLVVTSPITDATPAAFGAHSFSRDCGLEIARQYLVDTQVDIVLGGDLDPAPAPDKCAVYAAAFAVADVPSYIHTLAAANGYAVLTDRTALEAAVASGKTKLLGLFAPDKAGRGKTPEIFRVAAQDAYPREEPTLAEMTRAALAVLSQDAEGFFLVVEGSQIDWAGHARNLRMEIAEILGFEAAVDEVLHWLTNHPQRNSNTQLIVVADHETGGLAVTGPDRSPAHKGELVEAGWVGSHHTAQDTIVWSRGPGTEQLNRALDNTDLYRVMRQYLEQE